MHHIGLEFEEGTQKNKTIGCMRREIPSGNITLASPDGTSHPRPPDFWECGYLNDHKN